MEPLDPKWYVVNELIPLFAQDGIKPASVQRKLRRWIEEQVLPARRATPLEIAALLEAGRIHGLPPEGFVYLVDRADFERLRRPSRGAPFGRKRKKQQV